MSLLRNRNFCLLWLAQIISTLAAILFDVGVMVTIFERTGSALQTTGVTIALTLPPFLFGPFAGAAVDRFPRRWVMVTMEILRAGLMAWLWLVGAEVNVWLIYLVVAGLSTAATFYDPARLASIPSIVPKTELVRANSLIMGTNQVMFAIGFALGGWLILQFGLPGMVSLTLISFMMAAIVVSLVNMPHRSSAERQTAQTGSLRRDIVAGVVYLRHHYLARALVTMESLEFFPHAIWNSALMLVFAQQALGATLITWGYQNTAYFTGQLLGAMLATLLAARLGRQPGRMIIGNAFLASLLTLVYALSPNLTVAIIISLFFGPTSAMRDVVQDSLLQANVSPDVLGRVYAMRTMLFNFSFMVAGVSFAWLADHAPIRWVYLLGALLYFGTALYALSSPAIRHSRIQALEPANVLTL